MEDLIQAVISKKLRIKGHAYNLSENSGKAAIDFGYASKTASRLNKLCKAIVPSRNRGLYQQLLAKVITLVRADEIHELGQLRIGYGNIQTLKGFQFNGRQSWGGYVPWQTEVVCDLDEAVVQISIPKDKNWSRERYDDRVYKLQVEYHLVKLPFELDDEVATLHTKELIFTPGENGSSKTAKLSISGWDNCLLLLIGKVDTYLWKLNSQTEYAVSGDRYYRPAAILEVFGLRDGQLLVDRVIEKEKNTQLPPDDGADWE